MLLSGQVGLPGQQQQQASSRQPRLPPCCTLPLPPRSAVSVFLYALLTVLFTLAGLAYIILPKCAPAGPLPHFVMQPVELHCERPHAAADPPNPRLPCLPSTTTHLTTAG